jgi:hypothetical protein
MDPPGIEPGPGRCKRPVLPLDYGPSMMYEYLSLLVENKKIGGDPSAGSPTDTLCRLNPPY